MARIELKIVALSDFSSVNAQIKALQSQVELLNKSVAGVGLTSNLTKDLNAANLAFKNTMLSTGQFTQQTVQLRTETEKFGQALQSGKLSLGQYYSIIKQQSGTAMNSVKALALEQTKLQNSIVMADPTKKGFYSVYTPTSINALTNATKIAANQQNILNIAIDQGSKSLINWGKNTQWAGRQLTVGMSVPLIMFGSQAKKVFQDVNTEIVRMQKVYGTGLTQSSQQALDSIKEQTIGLAKELASSMGISVKETASMAADLAATGKTGNDLIVATREAMRLSKLGELDTQAAMKATISLQNVYKLSTKELAGAVDFLNAVENQTSTSLQDLVDGIPRVGPIVQQLGGSFKDTAIMMVAMKEAGVPAAQSANAIKSAIASLINPTKSAKDAFAAYNINVGKIATNEKGNPVKMIMALQGALKGLAPLAQSQLIEKLFGKFQEARIQALITNLGSANSQTKVAFDLMNANSQQLAGVANSEMKTATESATGKYKRAMETFKADLIPVGQKILEISTALMNFGNSVAKVFGSLPSPVKSLMGIVAIATALSGPIIMLTGLMANFVGYIIKAGFNLKLLLTGGAGIKELFTPKIVAANAAAELFSTGIMSDVDSVGLLNQAIRTLTISMEGLVTTMNVGTGMSMASTLASVESMAVGSMGRKGSFTPAHLPGMATGGFVPGSGNSDTYPALLTPGESVIPKGASAKYAPFINAMIKGILPKYEEGLGSAGVFTSDIGNDFINSGNYGSVPSSSMLRHRQVRPLPAVSSLVPDSGFNSDMTGKGANPQDWIDWNQKSRGPNGNKIGAIAQSPLRQLLMSQLKINPSDSAQIAEVANSEMLKIMTALAKRGIKIDDVLWKKIVNRSWAKALEPHFSSDPELKAKYEAEIAKVGGLRYTSIPHQRIEKEVPAGGFFKKQIKDKNNRIVVGRDGRVWTIQGTDENVTPYMKTSGTTTTDRSESGAMPYKKVKTQTTKDLMEAELGLTEKEAKSMVLAHAPSEQFLGRMATNPNVQIANPERNLTSKQLAEYNARNAGEIVATRTAENIVSEINIAAEAASPSKATKRAATNLVDGVVTGIKEGAPKVRSTSLSVSQTSLPGFENYGTVGPSSSPYGPSMENGNFVSGKGGKLSRVRSRMTNATGGMNIQSKMAGSAALMMAGQAAGSMLQSGSNVAGIAGSASSMAGMGMMFGPWGAAAGAALGLVTGGIGALMKAEKEHAAVANATFSTSANEIALFGMSSMDATIRTKNLLSSIPGIASSLSELTPKVQSYVNAINALPKNDPTAMFVEGLKKLNGNLKATAGQLRTKASEAISLGGMDPEKAKEYVMTMLAAAGRTKDFAEVWKSVQGSLSNSTTATTTILEKESQAIKKNGDSWKDVTNTAKDYNALNDAQKRLADTTLKLFGTITNSSLSYKDMSDRLEGIKKSGIDAGIGVDALTAAVKNSGTADAISSLQSITDGLRSMGGEAAVTLSNIMAIQALQNSGISLTDIQKSGNKDFAPPSKASNIYQRMLDYTKSPKGKAAITAAHKAYVLQQKAIAAITGDVSGTGATATTFKGSAQQQADVKALTTRISAQNAYKKTVEDELKAQQKITTELQRQQQFQQTKMDLQNQMRMARASGNFMGAAMLQQQLYSTQSEFTNQTAQNALQAKADAMTTVVDTLTSALADLRDAISNGNKTISKNVNPALTTSLINSEGKKTKQVIPAPIKKWRGGLLQGAGSSFSDSINLMASNGEYIVNANAVKQIGTPTLNAINSGSTAGIMGNTTYNVTVNAGSNASADDIAKTVISTIQRQNAMISTNRRVGG